MRHVIATSQVAFPIDMLTPIFERAEYTGSTQNLTAIGSVDKDMIFADSIDLQTPTLTGDITNGYAASLDVKVDTTTAPGSGGGMGGGGQPPAGGQPPPGEMPPSPPS